MGSTVQFSNTHLPVLANPGLHQGEEKREPAWMLPIQHACLKSSGITTDRGRMLFIAASRA